MHRKFVRKPERKRSFGRPRHRWEDIILDHKEGVRKRTEFIWLRTGFTDGIL
jgi:hypothetical protein